MVSSKTVFMVLAFFLVGTLMYSGLSNSKTEEKASEVQDVGTTPVTLTGTYSCLPYLDKSRVQTEECIFGFKASTGEYYAVNFGQSEHAMTQFRRGSHVRITGFLVAKETLSTNHWQPYDMKGIVTLTEPAQVIGE